MKKIGVFIFLWLYLAPLGAQKLKQDSLINDLDFRISLIERSASLEQEARGLELSRFRADLKSMVEEAESRIGRLTLSEIILGFLGLSTLGALFIAFLKFKRKMVWEYIPEQAQKVKLDTLKSLRKEIKKNSKEIAEDLLDENFDSWYELILRHEAEMAIKGQKRILVLSPEGDEEIVSDIKNYLQVEWGFQKVEFEEIAGNKCKLEEREAQERRVQDFDLVIFNNPKDEEADKAIMGQIISKNKESNPVFLYYGRFLNALPTSTTISTASNFRSTLIFRILELFRMQKMREISSQKDKDIEP